MTKRLVPQFNEMGHQSLGAKCSTWNPGTLAEPTVWNCVRCHGRTLCAVFILHLCLFSHALISTVPPILVGVPMQTSSENFVHHPLWNWLVGGLQHRGDFFAMSEISNVFIQECAVITCAAGAVTSPNSMNIFADTVLLVGKFI